MRESQKILANILGKENLILTEKNTSTASFTPSTRTIVMPTWVSLKYNDDVFNMFLGHEIGHALYTSQDMLESIPKHIPHSYVNVIEDVRIEKKIKKAYMGLIPVFKRAYQNINTDFFKYFDENNASFIDRINVFFKCGHLYNIKFSESEQEIVNELYNIETFEDVLYYANLIKKEHNNKEENTDSTNISFGIKEKGSKVLIGTLESDSDKELESEPNSDEELEEDSETKNEDGEELEDEKGLDQDGCTDNSESDLNEEEEDEINEEDYIVDTLKYSEDFMKHERSKLGVIYKPSISRKSKRTPKEFLNDFNKTYVDHVNKLGRERHSYKSYDEMLSILQQTNYYKNFMNDCKKDSQIMYNVFNRKKSANESKRAGSAKSGVIDVNALYKYKTDDDIFMNKVISAVGNNHGIVILLDSSGSMLPIMSDVLKQVLTVCLFCKKAKIPFEVINFAENVYRTFSSTLNENDFNEMATILICTLMPSYEFNSELAIRYNNKYYSDMHIYNTVSYTMMSRNSTFTFSALYTAYDLAHQLKRKHNINVMNTMLFTDGKSMGVHLQTLDEEDPAYTSYSSDISIYSKIMLRVGKQDKLVDLSKYISQYDGAKKQRYIDLVLSNIMCEEFKKIGNMIYVYCPTSGGNALKKHVAWFLNQQLSNEFQCDYYGYYDYNIIKNKLGKKLMSDFSKGGIVALGKFYKSVDECFVISPKVFNSASKYDKIVLGDKFDMEKDSCIVNAINVKSNELKQRKILANILASAVAAKL